MTLISSFPHLSTLAFVSRTWERTEKIILELLDLRAIERLQLWPKVLVQERGKLPNRLCQRGREVEETLLRCLIEEAWQVIPIGKVLGVVDAAGEITQVDAGE